MANLQGRKQTAEHIAHRVAAWHKSTALETLRKLAAARTGVQTGIPHTEEHKQKIAIAMLGKRNSLGTKRSLSFRQHLSEYWKDNPNHNHWIDGKGAERSTLRAKDMQRLEYRLWREEVFKRDRYACVWCGGGSGKLEADHIRPYSLFPELGYEVSNGRTLCKTCHAKTPSYKGRIRHWREEVAV